MISVLVLGKDSCFVIAAGIIRVLLYRYRTSRAELRAVSLLTCEYIYNDVGTKHY